MNSRQARAFLRGEMDFTPQRMMRYIRSRARLSTDEDIEDILQNALILVTQHFDPDHPDARLSLYCLSACNKAIAQNLERYHKVVLKKRSDAPPAQHYVEMLEMAREIAYEGASMTVKTMAPGKTFDEEAGAAGTGQFRTTSLDSLFEGEDGRSADDMFGWEAKIGGNAGEGDDPAGRAVIKDLIQQILEQLPSPLHRTCFVLKYVHGYKREDLIECLKMDAKSIDTVDKKIVRTLKAFREKLENDESRI